MQQQAVEQFEAHGLHGVERAVGVRFFVVAAQHPADEGDETIEAVGHDEIVPVDRKGSKGMHYSEAYIYAHIPISRVEITLLISLLCIDDTFCNSSNMAGMILDCRINCRSC